MACHIEGHWCAVYQGCRPEPSLLENLINSKFSHFSYVSTYNGKDQTEIGIVFSCTVLSSEMTKFPLLAIHCSNVNCTCTQFNWLSIITLSSYTIIQSQSGLQPFNTRGFKISYSWMTLKYKVSFWVKWDQYLLWNPISTSGPHYQPLLMQSLYHSEQQNI